MNKFSRRKSWRTGAVQILEGSELVIVPTDKCNSFRSVIMKKSMNTVENT